MTRTHFYPACAAVAFAAASLHAAELPEELIVSGFRPATTQELDTSISLLDAGTIDRAALTSFEQLVPLVPNMNLSGEASRARYFQLRGIGEREQYEGAPNPSVGFIVDDIDLSGIGGVAATYDIRRVEVLRGPQSARYGSSALAGIVYVQSAEPADGNDITVGAGNEDTRILGFAAGGAITDNLSGRISAYGYRDNGFRDNTFLDRDDTNERDERTARAKLNWSFADGWSAKLTGLYADYDNGYDAFSLRNDDTTGSDQPGVDRQETKAASLRMEGPLTASVDLVSITTFADSDIEFDFDADWENLDSFLPDYAVQYSSNNDRERTTYSQEFRLVSGDGAQIFDGSTDWVLGIYAQRLKEDDKLLDPGLFIDFDPLSCPSPEQMAGFTCSGVRDIDSRYEADTLALFAATETHLSERLSLSVGRECQCLRQDWPRNGYSA